MHRHLQFLLIAVVFAVTACDEAPELPRLNDDAVILAFGDSLTYGKGAGKNQSYPAVLETLLNRKVINAGVSGEVSTHGLRRLPGLLDQHSPELLILCHGGNDILRQMDMAEMANNIRAMIRHAGDRGIPVVMLGVPRPGLFLSSADVYREIAETTDVLFIEDLIPDILGNRSFKSDTVHPNAEGYRHMAEAIYAILREAGAA